MKQDYLNYQTIQEKLQELGYNLPEAPQSAANYVQYKHVGNLIYISGQAPFDNGKIMYKGAVETSISFKDTEESARLCAINILAQLDKAIGRKWELVKQCVKIGAFVNCAENFTDHSKVINAASDLLCHVLGERGTHTRFAVGAPSLPFGIPVEIDAIFEVASIK